MAFISCAQEIADGLAAGKTQTMIHSELGDRLSMPFRTFSWHIKYTLPAVKRLDPR